MAVYPGSPYGFGGMPYRSPYGGMGQGLPPGQVQYSTTSQYTITQPINTGGGGFMPGGQMPMGSPMGGIPQPQLGFGGQMPIGSPMALYGGMPQQQFGFGGQMPIGNQAALFGGMPQPQLGFGGQGYVPPIGQFQPQMGFGGPQIGMQQPSVLVGGPQFPTGGMPVTLGGNQFGGGGMQGFSNGNNVPSIQQLGAQAFGQWPVGVFSPQARIA